MSLNSQEIGPIPEETVRVARAVYPKGKVWMRMRDELGTIRWRRSRGYSSGGPL